MKNGMDRLLDRWDWFCERVAARTAWAAADTDRKPGKRGRWANERQYLLALLAYAIGLGNVLNFPQRVAKYGSAFILAYAVLLVFVGYPLVLLECAIGQFASRGDGHILRHMGPAAEGIGLTSSLYIPFLNAISYQATHAVVFFYLTSSFNMLWTKCFDIHIFPKRNWNTEFCFSGKSYHSCIGTCSQDSFYAKGGCYHVDDVYVHFVSQLQRCIMAGNAYASPDKYHGCDFDIHLKFDEFMRPQQFFHLLRPDSVSCDGLFNTAICGSSERIDVCPDTCTCEIVGETEVLLDLTHRHDQGEKHQKRADKLANILKLSRLDVDFVSRHGCWLHDEPLQRSWPLLACLFDRYCNATSDEATTPAVCVRRLVDPQETFSAQELYRYHVGKDFDSRWGWLPEPVLCLAFVWSIVCYSVLYWRRSSGRFITFTQLLFFPMIIVFAIFSVSLPGAGEGLREYLRPPSLCQLQNLRLWADALLQLIYSLSIQQGGLTVLSSYQSFSADVAFYALLMSLGDFAFAFIAGFGIFSILGYLSETMDSSVSRLLSSDNSILFGLVPQAAAYPTFPHGSIFVIFFYAMLCLLTLHTSTVYVLIIWTYLQDEWKQLRNYRRLIVVTLCSISFLLGIPFVSTFGVAIQGRFEPIFWKDTQPLVCFCSIVFYVYIYGGTNLVADWRLFDTARKLEEEPSSSGDEESSRWNLSRWMFVGPGRFYLYGCLYATAPLAVGTFLFYNYYTYFVEAAADWSLLRTILSALIGPVATLLFFAAGLLRAFLRRRREGGTRSLFRPTPRWGPLLMRHRALDERYAGAKTVTTQESGLASHPRPSRVLPSTDARSSATDVAAGSTSF